MTENQKDNKHLVQQTAHYPVSKMHQPLKQTEVQSTENFATNKDEKYLKTILRLSVSFSVKCTILVLICFFFRYGLF